VKNSWTGDSTTLRPCSSAIVGSYHAPRTARNYTAKILNFKSVFSIVPQLQVGLITSFIGSVCDAKLDEIEPVVV